MRLKELDKTKQVGLKFSKAFSEFTVLIYHNVLAATGSDHRQSQESDFLISQSQSEQTVAV